MPWWLGVSKAAIRAHVSAAPLKHLAQVAGMQGTLRGGLGKTLQVFGNELNRMPNDPNLMLVA